MTIEIDQTLRSTNSREGEDRRTVRVIEIERGLTGAARRLRVENTVTKRRTIISYPLRGRWELVDPDPVRP